MEPKTKRMKLKYDLSTEDFFKGEWLAELEKQFEGYEKLDINYKDGVLTASGYITKFSGDDKSGRRRKRK